VNQKIAEKVVGGYKKIEEGTVGGYKKIEDSVVGGFNKMTDKIVGKNNRSGINWDYGCFAARCGYVPYYGVENSENCRRENTAYFYSHSLQRCLKSSGVNWEEEM